MTAEEMLEADAGNLGKDRECFGCHEESYWRRLRALVLTQRARGEGGPGHA